MSQLPAYLTGVELALIKRDFNVLFRSKEATRITIRFQQINTSVPDPTFGGDAGDAVTVNITGVPCIMKVIGEFDDKILKFGILAVGDAIFYFDTDQSFLTGVPGSTEIIDQDGNAWKTAPYDQKFYNYIQTIIGNTKLAQAIAAKIQQ